MRCVTGTKIIVLIQQNLFVTFTNCLLNEHTQFYMTNIFCSILTQIFLFQWRIAYNKIVNLTNLFLECTNVTWITWESPLSGNEQEIRAAERTHWQKHTSYSKLQRPFVSAWCIYKRFSLEKDWTRMRPTPPCFSLHFGGTGTIQYKHYEREKKAMQLRQRLFVLRAHATNTARLLRSNHNQPHNKTTCLCCLLFQKGLFLPLLKGKLT